MRWTVAVLTLTLALAPLACKGHKRATVQMIEEGPPQLATVVHMADPRAAAQLLSGFYGVEHNAWRWTAGKFSVALRPPRTAAQKGATLELKFTVPDAVIAKLKAVSLSASVNGAPLGAESYAQAGQFTYSRDVPASALTGDSVKVDFVLDKFLPPSPADQRELGVVATSVGFEPK
jgi:hypothetical protein